MTQVIGADWFYGSTSLRDEMYRRADRPNGNHNQTEPLDFGPFSLGRTVSAL